MAEPSAKQSFPVFLDMTSRLAVIVGAGRQAEKRAKQLARYGADIVVIDPDPGDALVDAQAQEVVTLVTRPYCSGDLQGAFVVLCVTDDDEVRQAVFSEAESLGCLLNVSGAPHLCNFVLPSVHRQGHLEVAVSTGGVAPPVAKAFRRWLAEKVGDEWSTWILLASEVHAAVAALEDASHADRAIAAVSDGALFARLEAGETITAADIIAAAAVEAEE